MAYTAPLNNPYRSSAKLRRDNCLSEITSNATLLARTLSNLGLSGITTNQYTTTATAAGTTTLTAASTYQQFFTGSTTQNVVLPVVSTLTLGQQFQINNVSSGAVTVKSSGGNTILVLAANSVAEFTCILLTGTDANSWDYEYQGAVQASGKLLTVNNSLTFAGTDGTTHTFPSTSSTVARTDAANTFTGASTATSWNVVSPVITTGLTASGSASNDYSASTGTFKTSSGLNTLGGKVAFKVIATPVAAAGSSGSDAAALGSANIVTVSSDSAAKGVKLLTGVAGDKIDILNTTATAAILYPATGGTINGLAANAGVLIPASKGTFAVCTAADTWTAFDRTAASTAA